jgi:signal transduction histidine kinase
MPPEALRHVLLNLLLNARTSLRDSNGEIAVDLERPRERSTWCDDPVVRLRIRDNGRGMSAAKLESIRRNMLAIGEVERSGTASLSRAPTRQPGLGLLLCRRLLAAHGAELSLDSKESSGTTATVALPVAA